MLLKNVYLLPGELLQHRQLHPAAVLGGGQVHQQGGGHAGAVAYVAAMPRNQDTLDAFLAQAETSGLVISEVATKSKTRWMRASPDLSKVKLFRLTNEV